MRDVMLYLAMQFAQKVCVAGTRRGGVLDHDALEHLGLQGGVDAQAHDLQVKEMGSGVLELTDNTTEFLREQIVKLGQMRHEGIDLAEIGDIKELYKSLGRDNVADEEPQLEAVIYKSIKSIGCIPMR